MSKIMGFYADVNSVYHGFERASPRSTSEARAGAGQGTEAFNINTPGDIAGAYIDANGVNHGFLRTKNGAITTTLQARALVEAKVPFRSSTTMSTRSPDGALTRAM
jgi:hypothetical protein